MKNQRKIPKCIFPGPTAQARCELPLLTQGNPAWPSHSKGMATTTRAGEGKPQEETRKSSNSKDGAKLGTAPAPEISWFDLVTH